MGSEKPAEEATGELGGPTRPTQETGVKDGSSPTLTCRRPAPAPETPGRLLPRRLTPPRSQPEIISGEESRQRRRCLLPTAGHDSSACRPFREDTAEALRSTRRDSGGADTPSGCRPDQDHLRAPRSGRWRPSSRSYSAIGASFCCHTARQRKHLSLYVEHKLSGLADASVPASKRA